MSEECSPREVENGGYYAQATPRRRGLLHMLNILNPMTPRQRSHPYPPTPIHQHTSTKTAHKYVVTETPILESELEPLLTTTRQRVFVAFKWASLIVPVAILCFFGLVHIVAFAINGHALLEQKDYDFLPDWGYGRTIKEASVQSTTDVTRGVLPIPVHSHNDYLRHVPIFEALHFGCTGIEADVWLNGDDLLVGHTKSSLSSNKTFTSLYVDPLIKLLDRQNNQTISADTSIQGIFDDDSEQTLVLLVDFKTEGYSTFRKVHEQLEGFRAKNYLTYFNGTHTVPGPITVVGTGNTPFDILTANTTYRDIFYDAPLSMLYEPSPITISDTNTDPELRGRTKPDHQSSGQGMHGLPADITASEFNLTSSYYASVNFKEVVGHVWRGKLSHKQMNMIRGQIRGAKKAGLKARYWNTPSWPVSLRNHVWRVLEQEGVGMLNADALHDAANEDWRRWKAGLFG